MSDKLQKFIKKIGSKGLKYEDPRLLDLNVIDKKLVKAIKNINQSNWCWTLFSCQGHTCKNDDLSLPYIVFIVKNSRISNFLSLINTTLPKSNFKELPIHSNHHFTISRGYSDNNFSIISIHWSINYVENKKSHSKLISDLTAISKRVKIHV